MTHQTDCIFCKIVSGEIPATILYRDEWVTAFRDINPAAPIHILIIPNQHTASLAEMGDDHGPVLGRIVQVANQLAVREELRDSGYRLLVNTGPDAGQEVLHTHFHLVGGRPLGPLLAP